MTCRGNKQNNSASQIPSTEHLTIHNESPKRLKIVIATGGSGQDSPQETIVGGSGGREGEQRNTRRIQRNKTNSIESKA